jgi:hypothetical protein
MYENPSFSKKSVDNPVDKWLKVCSYEQVGVSGELRGENF